MENQPEYRCNRCHRPMQGTTAYDGACECGGLIEVKSNEKKVVQGLDKSTQIG